MPKAARKADWKIAKEQADAIRAWTEQEACRAGPITTSRLVESGESSAVMVKAARDMAVELLVGGTRGLTGSRELTKGSVADKATSGAHCPVMVVR